MYQFKNEPESWARLDYKIIQNGFVEPYKNQETLSADINWLQSEDYKINDFDCASWENRELMYTDLHAKFNFPVYIGRNLDALQESLNEEEIPNNGLVVVFRNFDALKSKTAHTILDIFVNTARFHLTFGERVLILIQVNPKFTIEPFGLVNLYWH